MKETTRPTPSNNSKKELLARADTQTARHTAANLPTLRKNVLASFQPPEVAMWGNLWGNSENKAERLAYQRSLAVEAVIGEPVSGSVFPVKRENTGNFRRSSLKNGTGLGFSHREIRGLWPNSLRIGTGNFLQQEINQFERMLVADGVRIVKCFLHITPAEQIRRFKDRLANPLKRWKLTHEDLRNQSRWTDYEVAIEDMLERTSTKNAPWHLIPTNDKPYGRLAAFTILIDRLGEGLRLEPRPLDPRIAEAVGKLFDFA